MTVFRTQYPTPEDVEAILNPLGISLSELPTQEALDYCRGLIEPPGASPLLAVAAATARTYPPQHPDVGLIHTHPFVALTSVSYQPTGAAAQALTLNTDYVRVPSWADAATAIPFDAIQLLNPWGWAPPLNPVYRDAIVVTARWGWGDVITPDDWSALVAGACLQLFPYLQFRHTGGREQRTQLTDKTVWGKDAMTQFKDAWSNQWTSLQRRRRPVPLNLLQPWPTL